MHVLKKIALSGMPKDKSVQQKLEEAKFQIFAKKEPLAFLEDLAEQIKHAALTK